MSLTLLVLSVLFLLWSLIKETFETFDILTPDWSYGKHKHFYNTCCFLGYNAINFRWICTDNRVLGLEVEADKMGQVSIFIKKKITLVFIPQSWFLSILSKQKETIFLSPDLGHLGFRWWWGRWRCCGQETSWGLCQPYVPAGKPHGPGHRDNEKYKYKYQKCAPEQRKYFGVIPQN